jgi:hypothetical protein
MDIPVQGKEQASQCNPETQAGLPAWPVLTGIHEWTFARTCTHMHMCTERFKRSHSWVCDAGPPWEETRVEKIPQLLLSTADVHTQPWFHLTQISQGAPEMQLAKTGAVHGPAEARAAQSSWQPQCESVTLPADSSRRHSLRQAHCC